MGFYTMTSEKSANNSSPAKGCFTKEVHTSQVSLHPEGHMYALWVYVVSLTGCVLDST